MLDHKDIEGLLLCGGRGSRLGGLDKGLIEWQGRPLFVNQLEKISGQVESVIISANRNLEGYKKYVDCVVSDEIKGFQGPLAGVAAALPHVARNWIWVVPVDMPNLSQDFLSQFLKAIGDVGSDRGFYVVTEQRAHYLCALLHRSCESELQRFLSNGQRRVRDFHQLINSRAVTLTMDDAVFANINTESDLKQLTTNSSSA